MEESDYPNASKVKAIITKQIEDAKAAQAQQNQMAQLMQQIGANNVMPGM